MTTVVKALYLLHSYIAFASWKRLSGSYVDVEMCIDADECTEHPHIVPYMNPREAKYQVLQAETSGYPPTFPLRRNERDD